MHRGARGLVHKHGLHTEIEKMRLADNTDPVLYRDQIDTGVVILILRINRVSRDLGMLLHEIELIGRHWFMLWIQRP